MGQPQILLDLPPGGRCKVRTQADAAEEPV